MWEYVYRGGGRRLIRRGVDSFGAVWVTVVGVQREFCFLGRSGRHRGLGAVDWWWVVGLRGGCVARGFVLDLIVFMVGGFPVSGWEGSAGGL